MDKQKISPFYRTLSPIGAVAKKVVMDQGAEEEEEEEEEDEQGVKEEEEEDEDGSGMTIRLLSARFTV